MIPIALFNKFLSKKFSVSLKFSNMARRSSKTNELRDIDSIGCLARNITILTWEFDYFKIKIITFIINLGGKYIISNGQKQA